MNDPTTTTDPRPSEARSSEARITEARARDPRNEPTQPIPKPASSLPGEQELPAQRRDELRKDWLQIQGSFIDEPGEAVRKADFLVKQLLASVSERFEAARSDLEREWGKGAETSTESLRLALQRYRALFERLLSF